MQRLAAATWGAWLLVFAYIGVWKESAHFRSQPPEIGSPEASIDDVLGNFLRIGVSSRDLRDLPLEGAPTHPVLVLGPGDDWTMSGVHYALSYELWPRPVWASGRMQNAAASPYSLMPGGPLDPAMLVIYRLTPPAELGTRARRLSAALSIVPLPPAAR